VARDWPTPPDTNLPGEPMEDPSHLPCIQAGASFGGKERCCRVMREQAVTLRGVFVEDLLRCRM